MRTEKSWTDPSNFMKELGSNFLQINQTKDPKDSIQKLLQYLGNVFMGERAYVFEIYENATMNNTYEWCDEGVVSQIDMLQNEPVEEFEWWFVMFRQSQPIVITDIEEIKDRYQAAYATLKIQGIRSLFTAPIYIDGEIKGFWGIDNPNFEMAKQIVPFLFMISELFSTLIINRNLLTKLNYYEYHDQLTLSFNRNALNRDLKESYKWKSLGIIYCDIFELKKVNSSMGFEVGDELIKKWNDLLVHNFDNFNIYRTGGDEFIAICPDIERWQFAEAVNYLEKLIEDDDNPIAFGVSWDNKLPLDTEGMLFEAERLMNKEKEGYYKNALFKYRTDKVSALVKGEGSDWINDIEEHSIYHFIKSHYFNFETFFKSMSIANQYPYFGDLKANLWYVSDSLRDLMGFGDNIVSDLLTKWERFIPYPEDIQAYRKDLQKALSVQGSIYDMVYRIQDKNCNEHWIRCLGVTEWNAEKTEALFFCGNISKLNYAIAVDAVTNFPREEAAVREIVKLQKLSEKISFVCFKLNEFNEINELRGKEVADSLLRDIANKLSHYFEKKVNFYRLVGLRFLAIISQDYNGSPEDVAGKILEIVQDRITDYKIPIRIPCGIGILDDYNKAMTVKEIMKDIMSLLEITKQNKENQIIHSANTVKVHRKQKLMIMELRKNVIDYSNFRVVIQPIVDAKSHKIVGGELLLRWKYNSEDVSPELFIPALERNNLINTVGRGVFEQAVRYCKRMRTYNPEFFLDFNVSYNQINDETLLPFMRDTLKKWGVDAEYLVLELTETHYNHTPVKLQGFIEECKALGMKMALDDFGVGYSSLEMLLKYPANVVKLDRSLMKKMSDSKEISDFITTIVYACHKFGKKVCVEGVETQQELSIVTEAGCDMIQGFYFYKPMEINEVYQLLSSSVD